MKKKPQQKTSKTEVTAQGLALSILGFRYYKNSVSYVSDNTSQANGKRSLFKKILGWFFPKHF